MVGADETTELWQHIVIKILFIVIGTVGRYLVTANKQSKIAVSSLR